MVNMSSFSSWALLLVPVPSLLGCGANRLCPPVMQTAGARVAFRPPARAFAVAWPILNLLLGLSWWQAMTCGSGSQWNGGGVDGVGVGLRLAVCAAAYILLSLVLALWTVTYSCARRKREAVWVAAAAVGAAVACLSVGDTCSRLLLSPLVACLIFALQMNATEVQLEAQSAAADTRHD